MTVRQNVILAIAFICYLAATQVLKSYGFVGFAAGITGACAVGLHRFNRVSGAYDRWSPFWRRITNAGVVFMTIFGVTGFAYEIYKLAGAT